MNDEIRMSNDEGTMLPANHANRREKIKGNRGSWSVTALGEVDHEWTLIDLCLFVLIRGQSSGPRHCGRDCEKRNNGEVFSTVFFVRDNQRRLPGGKAHEIAVGNLKQPSRSRFDLERFVLGNQLFQQRRIHRIIEDSTTNQHESTLRELADDHQNLSKTNGAGTASCAKNYS
jgi:hypothetical protein